LRVRGLLHRIASDNPSHKERTVESVLENLHAILNSEQGGGLCAPELGLDLQKLLVRWPSSRHGVLLQIKEVISRYEPRLRNVEVTFLPEESPNRIAVLIAAELGGRAFRAKTELASPGGIAVRKRAID
jgi:type VI secretion system protein